MQRICRTMLCLLSTSGMLLSLLLQSPRLADAATSLPGAEIVQIENATTTHEVKDYDGRKVKVVEPARSLAAIRTINNDGIVRGTLAAADPKTHHVKVVTEAGQILVLSLPPSTFETVETGTSIEFVLPEQARR